MPLKESRIAANGMEFGLLEAGEGPLALCLHGFPDQARSYAGLIERLASEGYRAVAPAMRGYHPSGKAPDGCYQGWATGSDAIALIEALGYDKAVVIGHDWGPSAPTPPPRARRSGCASWSPWPCLTARRWAAPSSPTAISSGAVGTCSSSRRRSPRWLCG